MYRSSHKLPDKYVSTREAAKLVGYTTDYVSRLAREKKISAVRADSKWLVDRDSLKLFSLEAEADKRQRNETLREKRLSERSAVLRSAKTDSLEDSIKRTSSIALLQTAVVGVCFFLVANIVWFTLESDIGASGFISGVERIGDELGSAVLVPNMTLVSQMAAVLMNDSVEDEKNHSSSNIHVPSFDTENFSGVIVVESVQAGVRSADAHIFSDEIEVEFADDGTGVITPIFRNGEGEIYRLERLPAPDRDS